ncbi:hypothetical protein ACLOJK_040957, partial [Asimina triloba]
NFAYGNRWVSGLPTLICRVWVCFDNRYRGPPNWVPLLPTISAFARPNLGFDSVGDEDEMRNLLRLLPLEDGYLPRSDLGMLCWSWRLLAGRGPPDLRFEITSRCLPEMTGGRLQCWTAG